MTGYVRIQDGPGRKMIAWLFLRLHLLHLHLPRRLLRHLHLPRLLLLLFHLLHLHLPPLALLPRLQWGESVLQYARDARQVIHEMMSDFTCCLSLLLPRHILDHSKCFSLHNLYSLPTRHTFPEYQCLVSRFVRPMSFRIVSHRSRRVFQ